MHPALLLTLATIWPQDPPSQGQSTWQAQPTLGYLSTVALDKFAPFKTLGFPDRVVTLAAGFADLEGDGNQDAWFVAGGGTHQGELSVQMAKAPALGRFQAWPTPGSIISGHGYVHATTWRSAVFGRDRIAAAEPLRSHLSVVAFTKTSATDPRQGVWTTSDQTYLVGPGCFEVAAHDADGDGQDDLVCLVPGTGTKTGWTTVRKFRLAAVGGQVTTLYELAVDVPLPLQWLRPLDLNGDLRTDFVAYASNVGLVGYVDTGNQNFALAFALPLTLGVNHIDQGDLDHDGRDDVLVVLNDAAVVLLSRPGHALVPRLAWRPAGAAILLGGAILDADGDGSHDVVAFPLDVRNFVIFGFDRKRDAFLALRVQEPPPGQAAQYGAGSGPTGVPCCRGDVDGDGDVDMLLQLASGADWITLRNETRKHAPQKVLLTHEGQIGETGYLRERLSFDLPQSVLTDPEREIEVSVSMEDPATPGRYLAWGRAVLEIKPTQPTCSLLLYYQRDPARIVEVKNAGPYVRPGGITCAGDVFVSVHAKQKGGPRRFEAAYLHHQLGGEEQKSALGVQWKVQATPPLSAMDQELLPWN